MTISTVAVGSAAVILVSSTALSGMISSGAIGFSMASYNPSADR
jgi:hypothetical protein